MSYQQSSDVESGSGELVETPVTIPIVLVNLDESREKIGRYWSFLVGLGLNIFEIAVGSMAIDALQSTTTIMSRNILTNLYICVAMFVIGFMSGVFTLILVSKYNVFIYVVMICHTMNLAMISAYLWNKTESQDSEVQLINTLMIVLCAVKIGYIYVWGYTI